MKFILSLIFILVAALPAQAFEGLNSGTSLDIFNRINCSTGITCTRTGNGLFTMVSSPTVTGAAITVTAAEATNAILGLEADEADDNGDTWLLESVAADNSVTLSNDTSGSSVAKLTLSTAGDLTIAGALSGFLNKQVAATATTITAAQCGSTFINTGAVQMELPEASAVLGCRLTFITGNASNFDVNPDDADQILVLTNAAGDAIRNATLGNSVTIEAISASQWAEVSDIGTWTDID